jgi:hypothetical protein
VRIWPLWVGLLMVAALAAILVTANLRASATGDTAADRWTQIEGKWSPQREQARANRAAGSLDFVAQLRDYRALYDATKGWLDDVRTYDWTKDDPTGTVASNVRTFLDDGQSYLALLQQAYSAATPAEVAALADSLPAADQAWDMDVAVVRLALGLPVVAPPAS